MALSFIRLATWATWLGLPLIARRIPRSASAARMAATAGRASCLGRRSAPVAEDHPIIRLPAGVAELFLLGDGDGDQFATGLAMRRACLRFLRAYPGLVVRIAMAPAGKDFNDLLLEAA